MKTKLILLLLALMALAVFAACQAEDAPVTTEAPVSSTTTPATTTAPVTTSPLEGDDAKAAYRYVFQTMKALGGYEATVEEVHGLGAQTTKLKSTVKVNLLDGKKGFISSRVNQAYESVDMTYLDGEVYCLVKSTGVSLKYKTTDRAVTLAFDELFSDFEESGKESDIASVAFVKRESGECRFQVTFDAAVGRKLVFDLYESEHPSAFSDIGYTAEFECNADGYITQIQYKLYFTFDGARCSYITETTYHNVGSVPEISAPDDASSYVDESELG